MKIPLSTFQRNDSKENTAGGHTEINSSAKLQEDSAGLIKAPRSPLKNDNLSPGPGVTPLLKLNSAIADQGIILTKVMNESKSAA